VRPDFDKKPQQRYSVTINFSCDPTRTDELVKALFQTIGQFRFTGPTSGQVRDVKSALVRDLETNGRDNAYLLNQIAYKYQYDEDVAEVFTLPTYYDELTPMAIRDAAQAYLNTNRYVKVTLVPETTAR
jgi:zinc protease